MSRSFPNGKAAAMALCLALTLPGCSKEEPEQGAEPAVEVSAPAAAVQEFYRRMNEGDYAAALDLYAADTRGIFSDPASGGGAEAFQEWAVQETRSGTVRKVSILHDEETGDWAKVNFEVVYRDGPAARRSVTLTREDGAWKLGVIS